MSGITIIATEGLVERVNTVTLRSIVNSISRLETNTHLNNKDPVRTAQ